MLKGLLSKVVGDPNEREVQKMTPLVEAINALEADMERRSDVELGELTPAFRARLHSGESPDDIMVEAFATVREVAKRTVDMRPFDVQLIGAIVLHQGKVAEMRTGEGKTLVATMPVYLNALTGRGVHLITVNDYLARRDALWMAPCYHLLGLSIGLLQSGASQPSYIYDPDYQRDPYPGLRPVPRRVAYAADVTYGTNNEFGFDYLRDNVALTLERRVQRPLHYAIVDEVDNIFIDEARTPLIISGPSGEPVEEYSRFAAIARKLEPEVHYEMDEKGRSVFLTDEGLAIVEQETGIDNIYDEANYRYVHYMQQALKAQVLFLEGRDYIRQRKSIVLVDQHTGRLMPSRRLSEGLHQAIEAKENVTIRPRDVTSATITIQNYFRMYDKLAGMSGTAVTESEEFFKIYELDVLAIPTNKPVIRDDSADVVYRSEEAKYRAVARELLACHSRGQPVLVGTTSVEMSERLSKRLTGDRLQMAALAPRIAYALQDIDLESAERAGLRKTMNDSLETMNSAAWRRLARAVDINPNALSPDNLDWIAQRQDLTDPDARRVLERAFREGVPHQILNAKEHTSEASIIARAGEPGSVTIATNMAGRGVDIKLGGELSDKVIHNAHQALKGRGLDPFTATSAQMDSAIAEVTPQYAKRREKALAAGGLFVLGTERHEARRIDNQLRGRSGRQGEPGASRFYLSLEDDLMRRFGRREVLSKLMEQIGDDFPIEHNLVSRTIERAQTSVEGHNFDIRKHLLEYDDVLNRQRGTIYDERLRILKSTGLRNEVWQMLEAQVDEYIEKYGQDPDQYRLLFAGLDDVVPLILPAPGADFQGPLDFGGHLTAYPPFTISFLADQFVGQPLKDVQQSLDDLTRLASASYGQSLTQTVSEISQTTQDKYEERLERYQALLDEKIDDYMQLAEERGQPPDIRRLAQHLERTYPLTLTTPRGAPGEELRDHWLSEVEIEYHRQTCAGFIDHVQRRMPADIRVDRLRPSRITPAKLADELRRVRDLASKQPRGDDARRQLDHNLPPADPTPDQVLEFIDATKEHSKLDFGRLDRLVGHVLGSYLDDLLGQYLKVMDDDQGRLQRNLERAQASVVEGKKGGRANNLLGLFRDLNNQIHLEIPDLEHLLGLAVSHEYDKWAQRQITEIETAIDRHPLTGTTWASISEHLLASHYTQKQSYDKGHRRRTVWLPRLPFNFVAQAQVSRLEADELRETVLYSLRWALEQRDQTWGTLTLRRWKDKNLDDLDEATRNSLSRFLGEQELGEQRTETVDNLAPDLQDHLQFILAFQELGNQRLADLPHGSGLLEHLGQDLEENILSTPLGELDNGLQEQVTEHLRLIGFLDDPSSRDNLVQRPVRNWEGRTRDEVARYLGQQSAEAYQNVAISELPPSERQTAIAFLQKQRYFVDEERIQRFLVHERLNDLPEPARQSALENLARASMNRLRQRKIASLDVKSRQVVVTSLQRAGLFTDSARRDELLDRSLTDLEPDVRAGFGIFLARQQTSTNSLSDLEPGARQAILEQLKQSDILSTPGRAQEVAHQRLNELDSAAASKIKEELVAQLRANLATKSMEELPPQTRTQVHQALDEQNYFVDQDKVRWYERNTLAHLTPDILSGLEQHLGQLQISELAGIPFGDLPGDIRSSLLELFDSQGLLADRAERLRLTQTGTLADLSPEARDAAILHLGRQDLVQIRNKRPPALSEDMRDKVWVYLRQQGHFADEFKEELFDFQRLDEFDAQVQHDVENALVSSLLATLDSTPIGDLVPDLRAEVDTRIRLSELLVDKALLQQVEESPVAHLSPELGRAVNAALGEYLLGQLGTPVISGMADQDQAALWRHLDEIGYFIDEKKQSQILQRRLADLGSAVLDAVAADLTESLEAQVADQPVSELDADLRQRLRQAVESSGYFESNDEKTKVLNRRLGDLRREDIESLSSEFGQAQLNQWAEQRLGELPQETQKAILSHLQVLGWFVDPQREAQLQGQPLRDLEPSIRQELVATIKSQQLVRLKQQPLSNLEGRQRRLAREYLHDQGLAADASQMRSLRRLALPDLDQDIYREFLRDLGSETLAEWGSTKFQDMDQEHQSVLTNFLGRQIMARIEQQVLLHTISGLWVNYLTDIEDLRRGIGLEAYGQRDPLIEYKRQAFELFEELRDNIRRTVVRQLFRRSPQALVAQ